MAIPLVQVRHKVTGRKTFLPETALRTFPDYVKTPSQKSREQVPDGTAFPAAVAVDEGSLGPQEPPRNGAGATNDAWQAYADELGLEVPEGSGRDEIIALVDARD